MFRNVPVNWGSVPFKSADDCLNHPGARMTKFIVLFISSLIGLFLPGCQTFEGTTTYFYADQRPEFPASVAVISQPNQDKSLEWGVYRDQIAAQLTKVGLEVTDARSADYLVTIDYGIDGAGDTRSISRPQYDSNGQMVGVRNTTHTVHQRSLVVHFFKRGADLSGSPTPLLQIRVLSAGASNELAIVMPVLTKQAFYRWPGTQGKSYNWAATQ